MDVKSLLTFGYHEHFLKQSLGCYPTTEPFEVVASGSWDSAFRRLGSTDDADRFADGLGWTQCWIGPIGQCCIGSLFQYSCADNVGSGSIGRDNNCLE